MNKKVIEKVLKDTNIKKLSLQDYEKHCDSIRELYKSVLTHNNDCLIISLEEVDTFITNNEIESWVKNGELFVYFFNNKLVGLLKGKYSPFKKMKHIFENVTLLVNQDYKEFGIGSKLIISLQNHLYLQNRNHVIFVFCQKEIIELYQKLGGEVLCEYFLSYYNTSIKKWYLIKWEAKNFI